MTLVPAAVATGTFGILGMFSLISHTKSLSTFCSVAPLKQSRQVRGFFNGMIEVYVQKIHTKETGEIRKKVFFETLRGEASGCGWKRGEDNDEDNDCDRSGSEAACAYAR